MLSIPEMNTFSIYFETHISPKKHYLIGEYFPDKYQLDVCLLYYIFYIGLHESENRSSAGEINNEMNVI